MIDDVKDRTPRKHLEAVLENANLVPLLYAVAKLGMADYLAAGPMTVTQLANATATNKRALYRVLRALATVGVFQENDANQFELTPLAELLREDAETSLRHQVLWRGSPIFSKPWSEILHTLKTGETAFNYIYGMNLFDYLDQHPDDKALFNNAMTHMTDQEGAAVADAYDFSGYNALIDIGGGHGSFIATVLSRHPNIQGAVFDLPNVVKGTQKRLEAAGIADRCKVIAGSFFESVPSGHDIYVLKDIIHDWDDEQSLAILRNCRAAMGDNAHLLLVERLISPGNGMQEGKWIDLSMMLLTGGMERTEQEYRNLLTAAGFILDRVTPTGIAHSVILGRPA